VIVTDASVLVVALVDSGRDGDTIRARLRNEELVAPELIDLEVASVLRRHVGGQLLSEERAVAALADLDDLPLVRAPHAPLLPRCWELRRNVTIYDAAYVAVAEAMQAPLLTGDMRLARTYGPRCHIEVMRLGKP
jgi:predicted nucleic acid-binding protein